MTTLTLELKELLSTIVEEGGICQGINNVFQKLEAEFGRCSWDEYACKEISSRIEEVSMEKGVEEEIEYQFQDLDWIGWDYSHTSIHLMQVDEKKDDDMLWLVIFRRELLEGEVVFETIEYYARVSSDDIRKWILSETHS